MIGFGRSMRFVALFVFVQGIALPQGPASPPLRELLLSPNIRHSTALKRLFLMGPKHTAEFVAAVNDPDQLVSDNAQFMIELIADPRGIEELGHWRQEQTVKRFVRGPVTPPLASGVYEQINANFLSRPYEKWDGDEAINYALALALQNDPVSHISLKRMMESVPESETDSGVSVILKRLQKGSIGAPICERGNVGESVLAHSIFLSTNEKRKTSIELIADDAESGKVLLRAFQPFGAYYLITLERKQSKCWSFRSIYYAGSN